MTKLKACPFCGGEAEIHQEVPNRPNDYDCIDKYTTFFIACKKCKASGGLWIGEHRLSDAINAWNKRYEPHDKAYTPARSERLKE